MESEWYARQYSDDIIKKLKAQADVAMAMSSKIYDLALMRRYSRRAQRRVGAHHRGLDGALENYAVHKSKSNCCVTGAVDREVNQLAAEKKTEAVARVAAADRSPPPVLETVADIATSCALYDEDKK